LGKLRTEFTTPIAKYTDPRLWDTTFFARCLCVTHCGLTKWKLKRTKRDVPFPPPESAAVHFLPCPFRHRPHRLQGRVLLYVLHIKTFAEIWQTNNWQKLWSILDTKKCYHLKKGHKRWPFQPDTVNKGDFLQCYHMLPYPKTKIRGFNKLTLFH